MEIAAGWVIRMWDGRGDRSQRTLAPTEQVVAVETRAEIHDDHPDEPILLVSSTRSLRRLVSKTGVAGETRDRGWREVSTHDLRRTWATALADAGVDPLLALDWGGWEDLEIFSDHYKGAYSPAAKRRAREKVGWL